MGKILMRELSLNFSNLKSRQLLAIIGIFVIVTITNERTSLFPYLMLCLGMFSIICTEMESRDKVYISILSAPCTRKEYVTGKFISSTIWILATATISVLVCKALYMINSNYFIDVNIVAVKFSVIYMIFMVVIYYLLYFSIGVKYAKISYYICFILLFMGSMSFYHIMDYVVAKKVINSGLKIIYSNTLIGNSILLVLVLAVVTLFSVISTIFYEKKDL